MDALRADAASRASSVQGTSSPTPSSSGPSNEDIEAVIQMATSARASPDGRSGPPRDTRTQLFVGNLPYRVRWQDLKDLFRKAGTVLRADVSLGPDNRSRGYGTVLLATAEDAGRAVDMFNGYSWQTRVLEVRPDRLPPDFDNPAGSTVPPPASAASPNPYNASAALGPGFLAAAGLSNDLEVNLMLGDLDRPTSSSGGCRNLFVGNLPFHCQWQDLKDLFRQAGTIIRADVALGQDGRSRGFGTVIFATEIDAERAVNMFNGYEYNGRALKVHYDKFTQSGQGMTVPTSPRAVPLGASQSNPFQAAHPGPIVLPAGYALDFGSAPNSPYGDYPPQLQMPVPHPQHTHSHILNRDSQLKELSRSFLSQEVDPLADAVYSISLGPRSQNSKEPSDQRNPRSPRKASASPSSSPSQPQQQQHPHHPGPIAIPPPPPVTSFGMIPNMSPGLMSISPLYYPNMSPMHHPAMVPITPHGLPPITPSMPPFTFSSHMQPLASPSTAQPPFPQPPPQLAPPPDPNNGSSAAPQQPPQAPQPPPMAPQTPSAGPFPHMRFPPPAHMFSPGLAMSPGAFWGRPGATAGNPYINPAVGAPVHMVQPSPGGFYFPHGLQPSPGPVQEPRGYFDAYFPPAPPAPGQESNGYTSTSVEGEILRDKSKHQPRPDARIPEDITSVDDPPQDNVQERTKEAEQIKRSLSTSHAEPWDHQQHLGDDDALEVEDGKDKGRNGFRTYSMSSSGSSAKRPFFSRPDSDPVLSSESTPPTSVGDDEDELARYEDTGKTPKGEEPGPLRASSAAASTSASKS